MFEDGSAPPAVLNAPRYLLGIDGGGTATRARLHGLGGSGWQVLGCGRAGPSALAQGVEQAWRHVDVAIAAAFANAGLGLAPPAACALGLGLAGAGRADLRAAFVAADPGYARCVLDTDARTTLLGAHGGRPGIVVSAGTGSVGAVLRADGSVQLSGGWGFPAGDEGGGAWLGLRAMQLAQAALDGRARPGPLVQAVWAFAGAAGADKHTLLAWCAGAGQHAFAQLAPLVFGAAEQGDAAAEAALQAAADALALIARSLQSAGCELPLALCGSVGERLANRWPADLLALRVTPAGDSADGALQLLRAAL